MIRRFESAQGFNRWGTELPEPAASASIPAISEELRRAALWRSVAALPPLQREVVLLRVVDDLSVADTAATLGRSEGTVKASLHRALATLRSCLDLASPEPASGATTDREREARR